jgi:hypothetical protein
MTKISKAKAAQIAGMHEKTLERHLKDEAFQKATGYEKNKLNGRVSFDEQKFRRHLAEMGADISEQTGAEPTEAETDIDAEIVNVETALVRGNESRSITRHARNSDLGAYELSAAIAAAFVLPHKIYVTLDEARDLTGFPKTQLFKFSELKFGRRVIKRSKLEKI